MLIKPSYNFNFSNNFKNIKIIKCLGIYKNVNIITYIILNNIYFFYNKRINYNRKAKYEFIFTPIIFLV